MAVHSAVGRKAGLTREEIDGLLDLDPSRFDRREWLALRYAQDRAFLDGGEPAGEHVNEYIRLYTPRERAHIGKLIRIMQFANYWNNRFRRRPWNPDAEGNSPDACAIPARMHTTTTP
jgi:hypothetical protein